VDNCVRAARNCGIAAALLAAVLAGCASSSDPASPGAEPRIHIDDAGVATATVAAARADVYEAVILEIRRRGSVEVSSLEGGWISGEIEGAPVRVEISSEAASSSPAITDNVSRAESLPAHTRIRIPPLGPSLEKTQRRGRAEMTAFDLARAIVARVGA
jgi:hypothetical protein